MKINRYLHIELPVKDTDIRLLYQEVTHSVFIETPVRTHASHGICIGEEELPALIEHLNILVKKIEENNGIK